MVKHCNTATIIQYNNSDYVRPSKLTSACFLNNFTVQSSYVF